MTDRAKFLAMAEHLTTQSYYESDWPDKQREVAMLMLAADMLRESIGEPSQHRDRFSRASNGTILQNGESAFHAKGSNPGSIGTRPKRRFTATCRNTGIRASSG